MRAALAALAAAGLLALTGCGEAAPADRAATLVPSDALLYLHASTNPDRDADQRLLGTLGAFPAVRALLERLPRPLDLRRDVRPWLGDEVGFALIDTGTPRADVLLLAAVRDRPKAEGFLTRVAGAQQGNQWRGVIIRRFSNLSAAFVDGFLAVGQETTVREAIDASKGQLAALSGQRVYRRLMAERPEARSADLWVAPQGVRRVLRALPGIGGAVGAVLDHPRLEGVGGTLVAEEEGLRLRLRSARPAQRQFEPTLPARVAQDAAAYVGLGSLDAFAPLLAPIRALARREAALDFERDVVRPLRGEVAVSITPRLPVPIVTLTALTTDERATREALARLQQPLVEALLGPEAEGAFQPRPVAGVEGFALRVSPGFELVYAVSGGRLAVSTAEAGVAQALDPDGDIRESARFGATVGALPDRAEALAFVDLSELLSLGEQTGLTGNPGFDAVRDDLRRIRAAGAVVRREGPDTTAELFFEIP